MDWDGTGQEDGFAVFGYFGSGVEASAAVEEAEEEAVCEENYEGDTYIGTADGVVEEDEYEGKRSVNGDTG